MGENYSRDNIISLYEKILINGLTEDINKEICNFFKWFINQQNFNHFKDLFFILNMILLIKTSPYISTSLMLYINEIEAKILRITAENFCEKEDCSSQEDKDYYYTNEKGVKIPAYLLPINNNFKLPESGNKGRVTIREYLNDNSVFAVDVEIDHTGKVLKMISDINYFSTEEKSYEEIYNGLLQDLLKNDQ